MVYFLDQLFYQPDVIHPKAYGEFISHVERGNSSLVYVYAVSSAIALIRVGGSMLFNLVYIIMVDASRPIGGVLFGLAFIQVARKLYNLKNEAKSLEVIPRFFASSINSLNESRLKLSRSVLYSSTIIDTVPAPISLSAVIFSRASPASHCWTTLLLTIPSIGAGIPRIIILQQSYKAPGMSNTVQMRFKSVSNGIWNWIGIVQACYIQYSIDDY